MFPARFKDRPGATYAVQTNWRAPKMDSELGILEKRIEECELIIGNTAKPKVCDLVSELRQALKNYCLQPDNADEVVKRPIDQLNNIINFVEKASDDNIQEKILSINSQTALVSHRLDLMKDIEELKSSLNIHSLAKLIQHECDIDANIDQYSALSERISGLNSFSARQQALLDSLFEYVESTLSTLETQKISQ
ncbi:unnamed protein product [Bursaphelenchus xylophilus]|uniref:(pine wood nematode) hypothetical protein n=1 Tax=Bursaphelenchus xylophilus TaxID=6326 RepID=A0A1I7RY45_BURXY|nr:unnamed protein product [Bursaphelenchus xylophilus]CAG9085275.1 unnamed protein product [Bursaphelenchus xylophilus]